MSYTGTGYTAGDFPNIVFDLIGNIMANINVNVATIVILVVAGIAIYLAKDALKGIWSMLTGIGRR